MTEQRKEIKISQNKRLLYVNHPQAGCLEIDIEILTRHENWMHRTDFSLKYEDLLTLVKEAQVYAEPCEKCGKPATVKTESGHYFCWNCWRQP